MRVTLLDLKTRALRKAYLPADTTTRADAVVTDSEWTDVANDGLAELQGIILAERQNHFEVTSKVRMTSGIDLTPLPDCFLSLREIFLIDAGVRAELDEYHLDELSGTTTTDTSSRPCYRIQGAMLRWQPLPASSYDVEITYLRSFQRLLQDRDEIDPQIPNGWERYVVAYMACYAKEKQGLDQTAHLAEMQRVAASIGALSLQKETGKSFVRDTSNRFNKNAGRTKLPWPRI